MTNSGHDAARAAQSIEALSTSAEFLLCAIRALAMGCDPKGRDVQDPVKWAHAKLEEGVKMLHTPD